MDNNLDKFLIARLINNLLFFKKEKQFDYNCNLSYQNTFDGIIPPYESWIFPLVEISTSTVEPSLLPFKKSFLSLSGGS